MTAEHTPDDPRPAVLSRRRLLFGGAAAGLGAAVALGTEQAVRAVTQSASDDGSEKDSEPAEALHGGDTIPFYGAHQAGVSTAPQSNAQFLALTLNDDVDRAALTRMMRLLTDDAARLTQGVAALADSEPELSALPARLTVTFGFGPRFVRTAAGASAVPDWLGPLPAFGIDELDERWNDGDLLIQIAADDALTVSHAARMLLK
ncbi:MAG: Dyp-type peroxidase, partial [Mycetocola sp.]